MGKFFVIDKNVRFGLHMKKEKTLIETVLKILNVEIGCAQIYISSSKSYKVAYMDYKDIRLTKNLLKYAQFPLYIHGSLVYNLNGNVNIDTIDDKIKKAKTEKSLQKWIDVKNKIPWNLEQTKKGLIEELDLCAEFGGQGVVVHIGSGENRKKAIKRIADTINYVLDGNKNRRIILENSAGEGNKIGGTLEEIAEIINLVSENKKNQVGVCIDTCHLFQAGEYDISQKREIERFFKDFDDKIGIKKLRLIHLNDSKKEFGCHRDLHEDLKKGYIFKDENLKYLIKKSIEYGIDMVLETPGDHYGEVSMLWEKQRQILKSHNF